MFINKINSHDQNKIIMKKRMKSKFSLFVALGLILFSCNTQNQEFKKTQQAEFNDFLKAQRRVENLQINDIQKNEFYSKFEKDLSIYLDSVQLFINWKGRIKNITTKESGKFTRLSFEIEYKPGEYREIIFKCSQILQTTELDNDYLFNEIKKIANNSTVYVDGFIKRKADNSIAYYDNTRLFDRRTLHPEYKFNVVAISNNSKTDTLSSSLHKAISIDFEMMDLFKQEYQKKITEKEREDKAESLKFDSIQSTLSEYEKSYSQRVRQYLLDDFMRE